MTQTEEPQSTAATGPSRHSEEGLVTGVSKFWRKKLDGLRTEQTRIEQVAERTPEEERKLDQIRGAVQVLTAVLADLQKIRPVNQSVLNR